MQDDLNSKCDGPEKVFAKSRYPLQFDEVSRRLMNRDGARSGQEHHSHENARERSRKKISQIIERLRYRIEDNN